jgi:hypothetical protein
LAGTRQPGTAPKITLLGSKETRLPLTQLKDDLKANHYGNFVSIDLMTGKAWLAGSVEQVLELSARDNPLGFFHVIQVSEKPASN